MDCFDARAGLWPPERPRLADEEVTRARHHVEACPACQEYFAQDHALLEAYDRIRQTPAPRGVKERVFDVLALARAGRPVEGVEPDRGRSRSRRAAPLWAAGVALVAIGGTALMMQSPVGTATVDAGESMFVEDYLRRAVGADHIETSDPAEVTRFLARELGLALAPIVSEHLELEGAEICLLEGRRGAMIVYKRGGEVISHYVVPNAGSQARDPGPGRRLDAVDGTPSVITWATSSLEQALVGDVPAEELISLARRAASLE